MNFGLRLRALELLMALCMYQTHVHPRGSYSYVDDIFDTQVIRYLFNHCTPEDKFPLEKSSTEVMLNFRGVIGDTTLSSVAWFCGSSVTPMDLYDACIAFFDVPTSTGSTETRLIAVPCVRPLCSVARKVAHSPDAERGSSVPSGDQIGVSALPKGGKNTGVEEWVYWIPCADSRWLQIVSTHRTVLGKRQALILTADEVTQRLEKNDLDIDMVHVSALEAEAELSKLVAGQIRRLFRQ